MNINSPLLWAGVILGGAVALQVLLHWRAHTLPWPRPPVYRAVVIGQTLFLIWSGLRLLALWLIPPLLASGCLQMVDGAIGVLGFVCAILIVGGIGFSPTGPEFFRARARGDRAARPAPGGYAGTGRPPFPREGPPWATRPPRRPHRRGRSGPS